jgi:hypothetical protein
MFVQILELLADSLPTYYLSRVIVYQDLHLEVGLEDLFRSLPQRESMLFEIVFQ